MRILIVEDSDKLRFHLKEGLVKAGYEVEATGDGREGLWHAQTRDFDAIVLDLMLPGMDGLSVLSRLRKLGKETSVLILTAKDRVEDRVKGLRAGADDYLVKPFSFDELVARLEALGRRRFGIAKSKITVRGLTVDTTAKAVTRDGKPIELTAREYCLLEFLALRRGRVLSRTEIEAHICDDNSDLNSNVVDAAIYSLRRKIDVGDEPSIIVTRRGMGYSMATGDDACPSEDA
ncbi:MAG TPA: response regulator transcription factor [Phycisphaerae bacterium]